MKNKIILGLAGFAVLFLATGFYIVHSIQIGTGKLDELIRLHQVEILREHFLIQIKRVQSDLALKNTRYSRRFDTVVTDVRRMEGVVNACFSCHHAPPVQVALDDLRVMTSRYEEALNRVLTIRANTERLAQEEDAAFQAGEELTEKVREMVALTSARLNQKTEMAIRDIARTKNILYSLITLGPLLSLGLAVFLIRGFTKPVNQLLEATRTLKSGNLDHRVEGLKAEFGELADSFNEMAVSLKEQMNKMQRADQMVVVGELAAGLAHEVKNPMAGIKAAMSVLSEEPYLTEEDRDVLQRVVKEIVHLEGLMKSFLNFAKPQKPLLETVNVNNILNTTLTFYLKAHSIDGNNERIRIEKDLQEIPAVRADTSQLQQVFLNLFLNALDAMPNGGTLGVRSGLEKDSGMIRIDISDSGKGIREDLLDKVFQPFFTTKAKGSGLGLAISRQLVEQHKGDIRVANRPGGGVVFTIRLPAMGGGEAAA
jgi:signal transduction histidine kinase